MRWRDILIGAFVTLIVTVIGGVIVYYATRVVQSSPQTERLIYSLDDPQTFKTQNTNLTFLSLRAGNVGDAPATGVVIGIDVDPKIKIIDESVSLSSGPAGSYSSMRNRSSGFTVQIPTLAPTETVAVLLLLDGIPEKGPAVGLKSDRSIGTIGQVVKGVGSRMPDKSTPQKISSFLVPLAFIAQLVLLFLMRRRLPFVMRRLIPTLRSANNTAFLYIHQGLLDEAERLLVEGITRSGADALMLANHALCLGLRGKTETANKMLDAAEFWGRMFHERAVVAFNRGIIALKSRDTKKGIEQLTTALQLSKPEILSYCSYSVWIKELEQSTPEVAAVLAQARGKHAATPS
jgi:hypothetical protein